MSDKRTETWRVESEDGAIEEVTITHAHYYWQGEYKGTLGDVAGWPRAAAAKVAAKCHMSVVSILAPGELTRAEALAAERERIATLLRNHADDRVNDAPAYSEAIYDAESLVRGERPVYAPRATLAESLATAWAGGARAMRDRAVAEALRGNGGVTAAEFAVIHAIAAQSTSGSTSSPEARIAYLLEAHPHAGACELVAWLIRALPLPEAPAAQPNDDDKEAT